MSFSSPKNQLQKTVSMTWVACKLNNFTKNGDIPYIIGRSVNEIIINIL
jgi:hypothetical protein